MKAVKTVWMKYYNTGRIKMIVACTIPRFNPLLLLPLELRDGQCVRATTTREQT